jgi:glutaredoxin
MLLAYIFGRDQRKVHPWSGFFVSILFPPSAGAPVASPGVAEHRVLMYSRRACHLCDEARDVLLVERERSSFAFEEIFIDGDDRLEHEHGLRVPVVVVDGAEEFEFSVQPDRLRTLLRD